MAAGLAKLAANLVMDGSTQIASVW